MALYIVYGLNTNGELGLGDNKPRDIFTRIGNIEIMAEDMNIQTRTSKDILIYLGYTFNLKSDIVKDTDIETLSTNKKEVIIERIEGVDNSGIKDASKFNPNYRITGEKIGRTPIIIKSGDTSSKNIWINVVNSEIAKASAKVVNGNGYTVTLKADGTVWGFGKINGQNIPEQIEIEEEIIDISSGISHILMLGKSGTVYALGANTFGELGTGNVITHNIPVKLSLTGITKVIAIENTSFGIDKEGNIYQWGQGYTKKPELNKNLKGAVEIGINYYLMPDGIVRSIKDNSTLQLSLNEYNPAEAPEIIEEKIMQMAEGTDHVLMLGESGKVYSYGKNAYGELGDRRNRSERKRNNDSCEKRGRKYFRKCKRNISWK